MWEARHGRDPDAAARCLQQGFRAVSRRYERATARPRFDHWAKIAALIIIAGVALYWIPFRLSPWPLVPTLKHLAAALNCDAARVLGLAPANRGTPGYWPSHDRDDDGIACEPRSEEHTSELQSLMRISYAVFCLKKKK